MKKIKITAFALAAVLSPAPALAAEIPQEAVPAYLTGESVCITENLISPILEEVQNGLGFGEAWGKASREIHSAILAGSTNGYGYADLTAIARNAILQYRDMYLRPEYYTEQETVVKGLISDLITAAGNGKRIYDRLCFHNPSYQKRRNFYWKKRFNKITVRCRRGCLAEKIRSYGRRFCAGALRRKKSR